MSLSQAGFHAQREHGLIEALDPRARLIGALVLVATFVSLHTFQGRFAALALGIALVALARIEARMIVRRLAHLEGFMILLLIMLPLTVPGNTLAALGPLRSLTAAWNAPLASC